MVEFGTWLNWLPAIGLSVLFTLFVLRFRPKSKPTGRKFVIVNIMFLVSGLFWALFWILFAVWSAGESATMPVWLAALPLIAGGSSTLVVLSGERGPKEEEPGLFTKIGAIGNFVSKAYLFFGVAGITLAGVVSLPAFNVGVGDIFSVAVQPAKLIPPLAVCFFLIVNLIVIKIPKRVTDAYGMVANLTDLGYWLFYGIAIALLSADAPVWLMTFPFIASFFAMAYHYSLHETWTILLGGAIGLALRAFILFALLGVLG